MGLRLESGLGLTRARARARARVRGTCSMFRKRYAISVMPGAASHPYSPTKTMGREKRKSMRKVRSVDTYEKTIGVSRIRSQMLTWVRVRVRVRLRLRLKVRVRVRVRLADAHRG